MRWSKKEAILLLVLNIFLYAHAVSVLKAEDVNNSTSFLSLTDKMNTECKCGANQDCLLKANNEPVCSCVSGYVEKVDNGVITCLKCDCHETQLCYLNDDGEADCRCASGQIEKMDDQGIKSCLYCNCPISHKCFVNDQGLADCRCPDGKVEKVENGVTTCLNCYCSFKHECFLDDSGRAACRCPKGKIETGHGIDSCAKCYCHETQECFLNEAGKVDCRCPTGYIEIMENGVKKCIECDCGVYGLCEFVDGQKKCTCAPSTAEYNGKCVECDCGSDGLCKFEFDRKKCICSPKTIERNGKCVAMETSTSYSTDIPSLMTRIRLSTRSPIQHSSPVPTYIPYLTTTDTYCSCGENSRSCRYDWRGVKECICFPGYAENNGYCNECNCGPYGSCSFLYGRKHCNCETPTVEERGVCVVTETTTTTVIPSTLPPTTRSCYCGDNAKSCFYNWEDEKICDCFPGYAVKDEYCYECDCGPYGSCKFVNDQKKCNCAPFTVEMNGVCVDVGTSSSESITESITTSTVLFSTEQECDCGPLGKCTWQFGRKTCICNPFTSEKNGKCVDCNCGVNSKSCNFNWKGEKICNCTSEYTQVDGFCEAICNGEKCVHGKCEVLKGDFICRCEGGFTGPRCEHVIQPKLNKPNLWIPMLFTVTFAIFLLLSGMFCFMCFMLNKRSKK